MLKKALIIITVPVLCAFGSLSGAFLVGLNIYTRSTTPLEETDATPTPVENIQAP